MINFSIITLITLVIIFLEAFVLDPIWWNGGKSDKPMSTIIRAVLVILIGVVSRYWLDDNYLFAGVFYAVTVYFAFFNYVVNWKLNHKWYYLGNDWFDRQLAKMPIMFRVGLHVWVLIVGVMTYLYLNGTIMQNARFIFDIVPYK
jgi:hypothetical protein